MRCTSTDLFTTNLCSSHQGSNLGVLSEEPASGHLSYGMAMEAWTQYVSLKHVQDYLVSQIRRPVSTYSSLKPELMFMYIGAS